MTLLARRRALILAIVILPGLLLCTSALAAPVARREQLQLITCERPAAEYLATLRGRITLHRAFLATGAKEDEEIIQSLKQQLRYLWGHYRTDAAASQELRVVLSSEEPVLIIQKKTAVPYGRDLVIDWKQVGPHLIINDPYTLRAIQAGQVRKGDAAVAVDYEARFKLGVCSLAQTVGAQPVTLTVPLPQDPWLFFWHVPARERRPMRYHGIVNTTNPCSDDDFAELPHPFYYWYDWQPGRRGPDASGNFFDCRQLLRPGVDFSPHVVRLTRYSAASRSFRSLRQAFGAGAGKGPVRATVLIGVLDHELRALDAQGLADRLAAGRGDLSARARALSGSDWAPAHEGGTAKLLHLLSDLGQVAQVRSSQPQVERGFLRVDIAATLRRSGRPLQLRAHLGLTDLFGPVPPQHWFILQRALAEDHLVIYAGHSGLGENFRLAQIEERLKLPHDEFVRAFRGAPHQLIAFLSCYSYMYFGQDLLAAGASRAVPGGEFVFTGDAYTKGDRGALALLDLVDQVLAPGNTAGRVDRLRFLDPEDFWLIKELGAVEAADRIAPAPGGAR